MKDNKEIDLSELQFEEAIQRVRCVARKEIEAINEAAAVSIKNVACSARKSIENLKNKDE